MHHQRSQIETKAVPVFRRKTPYPAFAQNAPDSGQGCGKESWAAGVYGQVNIANVWAIWEG